MLKERAFFFRLDMGAFSVRAFDSTVMDPNFPLVCVQTPHVPIGYSWLRSMVAIGSNPSFSPGTWNRGFINMYTESMVKG